MKIHLVKSYHQDECTLNEGAFLHLDAAEKHKVATADDSGCSMFIQSREVMDTGDLQYVLSFLAVVVSQGELSQGGEQAGNWAHAVEAMQRMERILKGK